MVECHYLVFGGATEQWFLPHCGAYVLRRISCCNLNGILSWLIKEEDLVIGSIQGFCSRKIQEDIKLACVYSQKILKT